MNMELAYKCQMLPERVINSRSLAIETLLRTGWNKELVETEIASALAWAKSQRMVAKQEKTRRTRATKKTHLKGDDALDLMFTSTGADPASIPRREVSK